MFQIRRMTFLQVVALLACASFAGGDEKAAAPASAGLKTESFDKDPGWEGYNNHIVPERRPKITQDFGYSAETSFSGKGKGELGGLVQRASEPAFYGDKIGPKTLDDRLSASGTFAFKKTTPGGGLFFGFFRAEQPGAGGRPICSLGMDIDCEGSGARLAVRLITGQNQSCGTFVTPFIPGKFRPTPIREDGTKYHWTLDYDPAGAEGRGRFTFSFHGDSPKPGEYIKPDMPEAHKREAQIRFPETTRFSVDLPAGYKQQKTVFDHFGLMNMMKPGGSAVVYFDDLRYLDREQDFSKDPKWDASGNKTTYEAKDVNGAHDFGFSAATNFAGGKPGEIGGTFWRSGKYAYYADRVGPFSLEDRLEARGRVILKAAGPDSDMFLGWFNSTEREKTPIDAGHFVGVHVGGPTRVGHYFHPSFANAKGTRAQSPGGPVLTPAKVFEWSLLYDPAAEGGNGAITVRLGEESVTLALKKGLKAQGATLDRFGLFTSDIGGQIVKIYLDDVSYTCVRPGR